LLKGLIRFLGATVLILIDCALRSFVKFRCQLIRLIGWEKLTGTFALLVEVLIILKHVLEELLATTRSSRRRCIVPWGLARRFLQGSCARRNRRLDCRVEISCAEGRHRNTVDRGCGACYRRFDFLG
jgi:hypothetical protein